MRTKWGILSLLAGILTVDTLLKLENLGPVGTIYRGNVRPMLAVGRARL